MIEITEDVLVDRINDMLLQANLHPDIRFLLVAAKKRIFAMTARDNAVHDRCSRLEKQTEELKETATSAMEQRDSWMEHYYSTLRDKHALQDGRNAEAGRLIELENQVRLWQKRCFELSDKLVKQERAIEPTYDKCRDCGCGLIFSARAIGDGYCHSCAHRRFRIAMDAIHFLRARTTENAGNSYNLFAYSFMPNWREFIRLTKEAGDTWQ